MSSDTTLEGSALGNGQGAIDGTSASNASNNTPAAPDVQAKRSKRHTIQVEYSALPSHMDDSNLLSQDDLLAAGGQPSSDAVAQARAAAQAALLGESYLPNQAPAVGGTSGVSSVATNNRSQTDVEMDDGAPGTQSSGGSHGPPMPIAAGKYGNGRGAAPRPRPMSMFASTEMQPDFACESALPPPISVIMDLGNGHLSSASSIDISMRGDEAGRIRPITMDPDQFGHRRNSGTVASRGSNSVSQRRPSVRSNTTGGFIGLSITRESSNRRGRLPEIPPILPVNSVNGEELGIGVGAGIASHVPRKIEDVLFPDNPTHQSPRLQPSGAASRVKSWFNRRTSRWGAAAVLGTDQPL
ncbi:hypothetical protein GGI04_006008, partial [Coemansia thaxteri]